MDTIDGEFPSAWREWVGPLSPEGKHILWLALEEIPEPYRSPLIIFYLEQQPINNVAESLGIGKVTVEGRLLRGRLMLPRHVRAILESACHRNPIAFRAGAWHRGQARAE